MRTPALAQPLRLALLLAVLLGTAACGSGGGLGGGDATLTFAPSSDATLLLGGTVDAAPGLNVGQLVVIGKVAGVRFPLFPFIDNTDTILSARLRLRQVSVTGSPFTTHGNVVVDYVDFGFSLGAGDNAAPVLASTVGTLSSDATLGFKEVDVTAQVIAAAAGNDFTVDFLLRFNALVLGPLVDFVSFENEAGGLGTPDGPELIVTYR